VCNQASATTKFSRKGLQRVQTYWNPTHNHHPLDLMRMDLSFDFSFENKWNKSNGTKEVTQVQSKSTSKGVQTRTQLEHLINKN